MHRCIISKRYNCTVGRSSKVEYWLRCWLMLFFIRLILLICDWSPLPMMPPHSSLSALDSLVWGLWVGCLELVWLHSIVGGLIRFCPIVIHFRLISDAHSRVSISVFLLSLSAKISRERFQSPPTPFVFPWFLDVTTTYSVRCSDKY